MSENVEIPNGWEIVNLDDLVIDPKKGLVDGPFGSNLKADEYTDSGIPVLKIQNIKASRFIDKNINYITYCSPNQRCSFWNFDREDLDAR